MSKRIQLEVYLRQLAALWHSNTLSSCSTVLTFTLNVFPHCDTMDVTRVCTEVLTSVDAIRRLATHEWTNEGRREKHGKLE